MERRICPILEYCKSSSQTPQGNSADNENMSMAKLLCLQLHIFLIFLSLRPNMVSWYGGVVFYCGPALCCVLLRVGVVLCFAMLCWDKVWFEQEEKSGDASFRNWFRETSQFMGVGLQAARPNSCPLEAEQQNTNYATADQHISLVKDQIVRRSLFAE